MKPLSLYDLDAELQQLENELIDAGGEVDDDTEARHDALLDARADKHEAYVALIRRFEVSADAVATERKRLQDTERSLANNAKRLKQRLLESMQRAGETERQTALGKVKVQTSGSRPVNVLVDVENLPEEFVRRSVSADLTAIKEALKEGNADLTRIAEFGPASEYVRIY